MQEMRIAAGSERQGEAPAKRGRPAWPDGPQVKPQQGHSIRFDGRDRDHYGMPRAGEGTRYVRRVIAKALL
jgi:hypothetical protein